MLGNSICFAMSEINLLLMFCIREQIKNITPLVMLLLCKEMHIYRIFIIVRGRLM